MYDRIIKQLKRHEGLRLKPYKCTAGKLTIGIGRNIEDIGITEDEADMLLANDIERVEMELTSKFDWFEDSLDDVKIVLINMCFNIGLPRLLGFKKTLSFLKHGKYYEASVEMLDSRWARQVGRRASELSSILSKL